MTFTVIYKGHAELIDIETLDELAYLHEQYGYRKMLIDMCHMTIEIVDNEIEENA